MLKANRWRWGRSIAAWFVPNSRDHRANRHRIEATAAALREAGFEVETVIDDTARITAEVEAGKIARQADRVEALQAMAERKQSDADAAWTKHEADVARLPEFGEPIKIGHHSEGRHRRTVARADSGARRGIEAQHDADRAAERAETATHTTGSRCAPVAVANRIEKLSADIRRIERQIDADRYDPETGYQPASDALKAARAKRAAPRLAELRDQLAYWVGVRHPAFTHEETSRYARPLCVGCATEPGVVQPIIVRRG